MEFVNLESDYHRLWTTVKIKPQYANLVIGRVNSLVKDYKRYKAVSEKTGVPWYLIAAIHSMEAGGRFDRHLHNGDPLTARTVQVPAGRPKEGKPPFTWEDSAYDALVNVKGLNKVTDWTIERCLFVLESYNGWGYRLHHPGTKSPYLWSFTNHYTSGKYVADGKWSASAVSKQIGAACLLKLLVEWKGAV